MHSNRSNLHSYISTHRGAAVGQRNCQQELQDTQSVTEGDIHHLGGLLLVSALASRSCKILRASQKERTTYAFLKCIARWPPKALDVQSHSHIGLLMR